MDNYCKSLQGTDFQGFFRYREVYSAQSSFFLAVGINLLELACKFKGTKVGVQIFDCLEKLIDSCPEGNIDGAFKTLLNVLREASYIDGIVWLEHYLSSNESNVLRSICDSLVSGLGLSSNEASQDMLDLLSEKLEVQINIEPYLRSSFPIKEKPIISLNSSPDNTIYYILYSEKFINYYKSPEIPFDLLANPVKKPRSSESLINTLIKTLTKKNLSGQIRTSLLEYKSQANDQRLNPLLPSSGSGHLLDLDTFPNTQASCLTCARPTQDTSPITFCKTHPFCLNCLLKSSSCPECKSTYPNESVSFLFLLVNS